MENEEIKIKKVEYEKLIETFSYFFKKMQTYYQNEKHSNNSIFFFYNYLDHNIQNHNNEIKNFINEKK